MKPSVSPQSGWSLDRRNPETIRAWMPFWRWFYEHYFPVQTSGLEQVPSDRPVLLVGSHNGGLATPDLSMGMYAWFRHFGVERPIYGLMHHKVWLGSPPLAHLAEECGALVAHPRPAMMALQQGASVLVYPGGGRDVFRPYSQRHQVCLYGNQGFIKLALRENVPIIPVVSTGAHETLIVLADVYPWVEKLHELGMPWLLGIDPEVFPIYLGLPWGVGIGPLFNLPLPRPIRIRLGPAIAFERSGRAAASDRAYVDQCYHHTQQTMQALLDELVQEQRSG